MCSHFINYYELNQDETYLEKPFLFDPAYRSLIHWANGEFGAIADLNNDNVMRFVSYYYKPGTGNSDYEMQEIHLTKEDELTSPIVAEGIVVYWLKEYHGKLSTSQIFNSYYDKKEKEYIQQNEKALDGWKRNFKIEFYEKHLQQIQQQIIISENIYPFLKEKDVGKIKELEANYLEFVKSKKQTMSDENDKELNQSESAKHMNMEESVLNYISATEMRFYYEGWRNGKHGAICQQNGIYRFVEQVPGKTGVPDDVKRNKDDNPIVAIGIVAYWLQFNSRMDIVIKRLTKYRNIPKDIREQFDNYTRIGFEQFKNEHRDDPDTWEWDWEYEFYTNYIIPHEIKLNKMSETLFNYISDSDIALVKAVMKNYIKYLKKCRAEKGYRVSPELLVLRAVDSQDKSKYEDLEDYEVNTILEEFKDKGYIDAIWVYGQKQPWTIKMLDKGRVYMKKLEEGEIIPPNNEQTSNSPHEDEQALSSSTEADDIISDENIRDWDLFKDWILKDRVIEAIKNIPADEVGGEVKRHFVIHKVLKEIGWLRHKQTTRYVGLMKYYKVVDFAAVDFRDNNLKPFKKIATTEWGNHLTPGTDLGENYRKFANTVRNTFTQNIDGELDDFKKFYTSGKRKYNQVVADNS